MTLHLFDADVLT